jgi:hypothetical protein
LSDLETSLKDVHEKEKAEWEDKLIEDLQSARTQPLISQLLERDYAELSNELERMRNELNENENLLTSMQTEKADLVKQARGEKCSNLMAIVNEFLEILSEN